MAGRPARPAGLKLLEGKKPGRDSGGRKVIPPPPFKRLPPEPPAVLTGEALAEWKRVLPELARLELVKPIDAAALTADCLCWARLVEAQREIDKVGVIIANEHGFAVRNPAIGVIENASRELRAWANEFGLTPASETKLSREDGGAASEANPFGATGS